MTVVIHTENGKKTVTRDMCERISDPEKRARCLELYDEIEWGTKFEIVMAVIGGILLCIYLAIKFGGLV